jgi:SAM-dependent methyltransferase
METGAAGGAEAAVVRLNWGCGPCARAGWLNADVRALPGVDVPGDIRDGLPLPDDSVAYAVGIHVLQDLSYLDVVPALRELRRVLRPGGVLRLGLPDLDRALAAYRRDDPAYFYVPDDEVAHIGSKLVVQIIWYGSVRTPFTVDFVAELLGKAGFARVARCRFGETHTAHAEIVTLDNRERESFFVEAWK